MEQPVATKLPIELLRALDITNGVTYNEITDKCIDRAILLTNDRNYTATLVPMMMFPDPDIKVMYRLMYVETLTDCDVCRKRFCVCDNLQLENTESKYIEKMPIDVIKSGLIRACVSVPITWITKYGEKYGYGALLSYTELAKNKLAMMPSMEAMPYASEDGNQHRCSTHAAYVKVAFHERPDLDFVFSVVLVGTS